MSGIMVFLHENLWCITMIRNKEKGRRDVIKLIEERIGEYRAISSNDGNRGRIRRSSKIAALKTIIRRINNYGYLNSTDIPNTKDVRLKRMMDA